MQVILECLKVAPGTSMTSNFIAQYVLLSYFFIFSSYISLDFAIYECAADFLNV
jgi:hypothetical protein